MITSSVAACETTSPVRRFRRISSTTCSRRAAELPVSFDAPLPVASIRSASNPTRPPVSVAVAIAAAANAANSSDDAASCARVARVGGATGTLEGVPMIAPDNGVGVGGRSTDLGESGGVPTLYRRTRHRRAQGEEHGAWLVFGTWLTAYKHESSTQPAINSWPAAGLRSLYVRQRDARRRAHASLGSVCHIGPQARSAGRSGAEPPDVRRAAGRRAARPFAGPGTVDCPSAGPGSHRRSARGLPAGDVPRTQHADDGADCPVSRGTAGPETGAA